MRGPETRSYQKKSSRKNRPKKIAQKKTGGCDSRHTPDTAAGGRNTVINAGQTPEPLESQMSKINTIALVPTILAFTLVAQTAAALLIVG